jgi:hypothetical protein
VRRHKRALPVFGQRRSVAPADGAG